MFEDLPILSFITFIPLLVAVILMIVAKFAGEEGREQMEKNAPRVALWGSMVVFVLALALTIDFDSSKAGFQFVEDTR